MVPAGDKEKLEMTIKDTNTWLNANQSAKKEEYEEKKEALEAASMPILQAMAEAAGAGGMPGACGMRDMGGAAPASGVSRGDEPAGGPAIQGIH
mmetsp:Transcript_46135/g.85781  ORF Transcript_46135/g.85781 Transcript_46135/m.85781 type:complete len:94 (+) Transcript_46135:235-516(+)